MLCKLFSCLDEAKWKDIYISVCLRRLGVFAFNERAVRLYERIGFVREGVNREAYYYDYKWHDRILLAILQEEWIALKKSVA
jgi:ribosomal protein S18 acetylase RimI-like enzyme